MKIGVIDSGIGGLTVLKSLLNRCPNHEYVYFGDTFNLPYGEKNKEDIIKYANNMIKFLESLSVDVIVIACGTISSLKNELSSSVRLIDIISPLDKKLDNYKLVSIIATTSSVKSNAFKNYINTEINLIACPKLVPIIESDDYSNLDSVLKDYLESTYDSDALILGCTHYPIIKDNIKKYFKKDIICLDDFVIDIVNELDSSNNSLKLYFSDLNDVLISNVKKILEKENLDIERKCLND